MTENIKIKKILFNTTFIVAFLWGISGFSKLYLFNHYGISFKLLNFDILESFVPVFRTLIEVIILLIMPLYLNYYCISKCKVIKITAYIILSIAWGFFLFSAYILPEYFLYYSGERDKVFALLGLLLFIASIFIYFSVLNSSKLFLLKDKFKLNLFNSLTIIISTLSVFVFIFIFSHSLLVGIRDYGTVDIVEKDNIEYFLLNNSELGLIVTTFDLSEKQNECYIQYGNYMIISPENTKFRKYNFDKIIIIKEQ